MQSFVRHLPQSETHIFVCLVMCLSPEAAQGDPSTKSTVVAFGNILQ